MTHLLFCFAPVTRNRQIGGDTRSDGCRRAGQTLRRATSGAKFFDEGQKDVFPREDFFLCTDRDRFPFALVLKKDENGIPYMTKHEVL